MGKSSSMYQHAVSEFQLRGFLGKAEPIPGSYVAIVLSVIDAFDYYRSKSRNIGNNVSLIKEILKRLYLHKVSPDFDEIGIENACRLICFLPLTPLKGEDAEWAYKTPTSDVNKRCARVMRDADNQAYDTECPTPDGETVRKIITFPYYPERKA